MPANAPELVAAVLEADLAVRAWPPLVMLDVTDHLNHLKRRHPGMPRVQGIKPAAWCVTVALLRRDHETVQEAADRLAAYLTLHAERWGETPTLANIRKEYLP